MLVGRWMGGWGGGGLKGPDYVLELLHNLGTTKVKVQYRHGKNKAAVVNVTDQIVTDFIMVARRPKVL